MTHARGQDMDRYLKPVMCCLPNPHGDLVKFVPTTSIQQANNHVEDVMSRENKDKSTEKSLLS